MEKRKKNIVICSDGTGNTFSKHVSNITRLIKSLDLSEPLTQIVFYDQGIGSNPSLVKDVKAYKAEKGQCRKGLKILPKPKILKTCLLRPFTRFAGLALGYGLRDNVKEMYKALAGCYDGEKDEQVFLFGFSRGAFAVRVLAGLIYRCGLPLVKTANDEARFEQCFSEAYEIYIPHKKDKSLSKKFREEYQVRDIEIQFLGIWDTVKSYGGIWPQSLPHLRHNPIVQKVHHALALDERRSWFIPTSWGGIDLDNAEDIRKDDPRYVEQKVKEMWFSGCHSDVGGGDREAETAKVPFRWILREAFASGLILNQAGEDELWSQDPLDPPEIHESLTGGWHITEIIPRWELDNRYRPPKRRFKWRSTGRRCPDNFKRKDQILRHPSVVDRGDIEQRHYKHASK